MSQLELDVEPADRYSVFACVAWRWPDAVVGLVPLVLIAVFSVAARRLSFPPLVPTLIGLFGFAWMIGYPLWVGRRRHVRLLQLPSPHTIRTELLMALPLLLFIWVGLVSAIAIWQRLSGEHARLMERFTDLPQAPNSAAKVATILLIVVLGPLAEEVFFRGLLYNTLRRYLPIRIAVVLQAALFGLGHPFGTTYILAAGLLGLAFGVVYEWRKTLFTPIVLHMLQNGAALFFTFLLAPTADSPWLGIGGEPGEGGCRVTLVQAGSAAEDAGLQVGDEIVSVDGKAVADMRTLTLLVRSKRVGDTLVLEVRRDGNDLTLRPVLKRKADSEPHSRSGE